MAGETEVYDVTEVKIERLESKPTVFVVRAKGNTRTSGWTGARLSRAIYVHPPEDGIQDYSFLATPPEGPASDVITPIEAEDRWTDPEEWVKGTRVTAETNSIEEKG